MKKIVMAVLVFSLCSLWLGCYAAEKAKDKAELRSYTCEKAEGRIIVDGVLSEGSWQKAKATGGFMKMLDNVGKPMTQYTEVKMLWDNKNLYIAFVVNDPDIFAVKTQDDGPLWEEENAEIFIDEDGDGKNYLEYEINPLNAIIDLRIDQPKPNGDVQPWQPKAVFNGDGIKRAVKVYGTVDNRSDVDEKWVAEIAIPLNNINFPYAKNLPPKDGDVWRANMFRIERPQKEVGPEEYGSWSKTPSWHLPQNFGKLVFSGKTVK